MNAKFAVLRIGKTKFEKKKERKEKKHQTFPFNTP